MRTLPAKIIYFVLSFVLIQTAAAQQQPQLTPAQQELADYIRDNYTKREVMIPARDGVKLFAAIYEPKDRTRKVPILLNRTPYTVARYGADKFKTSL